MGWAAWGWNPHGGEFFVPPISWKWVPGLFLGVKQPMCGTDHPPPNARLQMGCSYTASLCACIDMSWSNHCLYEMMVLHKWTFKYCVCDGNLNSTSTLTVLNNADITWNPRKSIRKCNPFKVLSWCLLMRQFHSASENMDIIVCYGLVIYRD